MQRPPDLMRKGGAMRDRTAYHRPDEEDVRVEDICFQCNSIIDEFGECDCDFLLGYECIDEEDWDDEGLEDLT